MNEERDELKIHIKKTKVPFAVFIMPDNSNKNEMSDYKQVLTDIISERITSKFN